MCNRLWSGQRERLAVAGLLLVVVSFIPNTSYAGTPEEVLGDELPMIVEACERNDCTGDFQLVVMAIRKAENGSSEPRHLEFGIMDKKANTYVKQAAWCAATVMKNYARWKETDRSLSFLQFLGNRYCPIGAENDNGTNQHWVKNTKYWYEKLGGQPID
jgi:hypothetical protein